MTHILRLFLLLGALLSCTRSMASELVELPDHFAVRPVGRLLEGGHQEILARDNPSEQFRLIGTTMPSHWDKPFSGPALEALEASVVAVSTDGKTLLYRHQKRKGLFAPTKAEGIYRHRFGEGERLLYPASQLTLSWSRYDKPLPRQTMAIEGSVCTIEKQCALNADDGSLTPLALHGSSPLHLAAYANDPDRARAALQPAGRVDDPNYWGFTALEIAVKKGHDDIALLLLGQGADGRRRQGPHPSALQLAVHLQRWRVLDALRNELRDPALLFYAFTRPPGFSQFMADDAKEHRQDALPRGVRMVLDSGLDPATVAEPLVFWLLDRTARGSDVQFETLKLLIDRGVRVDLPEPGSLETPLHLVAGERWSLQAGAGEVMALLLPRMRSLEAPDRFGLTALQTAMLLPDRGDGFAKALRLIQAGADDSVEYLCGSMRLRSRISIRQKLVEWQGVLPARHDCGAYR